MEKYVKDKSGEWWCVTKRGRVRAVKQKCKQCRKTFYKRHVQMCCSVKCRSESQRGNRKGPRPCAWCNKPFTPPARKNRLKTCSRRCAYDLGNSKRGRSGDKNPNWRGGVAPHGTSGYIRQYVPGRGQDLQHRVVMEGIIGRPLSKNENVHHKNGIRSDNRPGNLELWCKKQPPGRRVSDMLTYARWVIDTYGPLESVVG